VAFVVCLLSLIYGFVTLVDSQTFKVIPSEYYHPAVSAYLTIAMAGVEFLLLVRWFVFRGLRSVLRELCPFLLPDYSGHLSTRLLNAWLRERGRRHAEKVHSLEREPRILFAADEESDFWSLIDHVLTAKRKRLESVLVYCKIDIGSRVGGIWERLLKLQGVRSLREEAQKEAVFAFASRSQYDQQRYEERMLPITQMLDSVRTRGFSVRHSYSDGIQPVGAEGEEEESVRTLVETSEALVLICLRGKWYVASCGLDRTGVFRSGSFRECNDEDLQRLRGLTLVIEQRGKWEPTESERDHHHAFLIRQAQASEEILAVDWAIALGCAWEGFLYDAVSEATTTALARGARLQRVFVVASERDAEAAYEEVKKQLPKSLPLGFDLHDHFRWITAPEAWGIWRPRERVSEVTMKMVIDAKLDFAVVARHPSIFINKFGTGPTARSYSARTRERRVKWFHQLWRAAEGNRFDAVQEERGERRSDADNKGQDEEGQSDAESD